MPHQKKWKTALMLKGQHKDQPCRFLDFLKHDCIYLLQYNYTNL